MIRIPFLEPAVPASCAGLELLATAVLLLARDGRGQWANPSAENLFELSRKKFVRHRPAQLFGACPALEAAVAKAVATGASYTEQEIELGAGAKPRLHLSCTATPFDDGEGGVLLEFRHIDQQLKMAREQRLNEQQQANRELIRSLAHEIKNPLGGIRGAAQLLERELDDPQLIEYTQVIIGESDRLQSLVNRLLTPHRLPQYRPLNVHEVLVRVKGVVQAEFPQIPIACDFDISLPEIDADPEQLTQATLNVVRNAAQALAGTTTDPRIVLSTRVARNAMLAKKFHRLAVALAVEDNGPGVPDELREK
ncbi:partial two-component system, NtrC family, nitrogen regulation sensor histidine kinase GlnL, partial [Gammaproteobacteria bacterium]